MDKVIIKDNFFSIEDIREIKNFIFSSNWKTHCITNRNENRLSKSPYFSICLRNNAFFNFYLKEKIVSYINSCKNIKLDCVRVIALSQVYGQDSTFHKDHRNTYNDNNIITIKEKNNNNEDEDDEVIEKKTEEYFYDKDHYENKNKHYTFCLYLNEENIENSGGNIFFKIPNEKFILCIEPVFNRGVFFPADYRHKGTGYNIINPNMRLCITWKFVEILMSNPR